MKIVTVVGARPQFVKVAAVSREIEARQKKGAIIKEVIVHTGQHYDTNMSDIFFKELSIPAPTYNLGVGGGSHGQNTGRALEKIEEALVAEKPDLVLVYGDTDSTLAGALAAVKLHIRAAHVEAGLRSFNRRMPEEINRILVDHASDLLFCPTEAALGNLATEGVIDRAYNTGDVMYDISLACRDSVDVKKTLDRYGVTAGGYTLVTCHRAENTDDPERLGSIVSSISAMAEHEKVLFPIHPRTQKALATRGLKASLGKVARLEPVPFLDMVALLSSARVVVTDSGGMQKEAFFFGVPCVTMRDETEWSETVAFGANTICQANKELILAAWEKGGAGADYAAAPYGDGKAAKKIVDIVMELS